MTKNFILEQFDFAKDCFGGVKDPQNAYVEGMKEGFRIALKTYGIWKNGHQVIGCLDTPIHDIFVKELGDQ